MASPAHVWRRSFHSVRGRKPSLRPFPAPITDPSGALVPGVSVTIASQGTGLKRSALTDSSGEYRFAGLPTGNYSLRIEKTGFQSQIREGVELDFGCRSEDQFAARSRRPRTTNDGQRERCRDR